MKKTCIIIVGPTAVGKTSVAIEIAKHFHAEIISADSRQCFKEMNIGVARPSEEELQTVPHYFIASQSITEDINAVFFEKYALEKIDGIFKTHDFAVMVGGTGLYIKAFCEGMDEIPEVDPAIRDEVRKAYEEKGMEWLQSEIKKIDPAFFEKGEIQNPQRMMRALEVVKQTGQSILSFRRSNKVIRDFNIIKIGLNIPKEQLHQQIDHRVDEMMKAGLLEEVKTLLPYEKLNALQTVGYKELFDHLRGNITLDAATELIKKNTRQYAKRQLTWFKKDDSIQWFQPSDITAMTNCIIKISSDGF